MTDDERAALVEELARGASSINLHPYDLATTEQQAARRQQVEIYLMPIIDRYMAAHDLDALAVEWERMGWQFDETWVEDGKWTAWLRRSEPNSASAQGDGDTFTETIRNAVAQAKAATGEGEA